MDAIDQKTVRQFFDYGGDGMLRWRARDLEMFSSRWAWKVWNTKNPGNVAGADRANGYRSFRILGKSVQMHRLVYIYHHGDIPDGCFIDHIDGNPRNNRIENLRAVSQSINCRNKVRQSNNTSGSTGVSWHKDRRKWQAYGKVCGKTTYLGIHAKKEDAELAVLAFRKNNDFTERHGL